MPVDDLKALATSTTTDFYALLSLASTASATEIRSAYRRTSLKYHPDKVGSSPENLEKFHLLQIANDVLSDPALRADYDNVRNARESRKAETEKLEGRRREMKEALERREKAGGGTPVAGVKRGWGAREETAEEEMASTIQRISVNNRRKMQEALEQRRRERERLEREERQATQVQPPPATVHQHPPFAAATASTPHPANNSTTQPSPPDSSDAPSRSLTVRFPRIGPGLALDEPKLQKMFRGFGDIDSVVMREDKSSSRKKKKRHSEAPDTSSDSTTKPLMGTAWVVFSSISSAAEAVKGFQEKGWDVIEDVWWTGGKEPDGIESIMKENREKDGKTSATPLRPIGTSTAGTSTPTSTESTMAKLRNAQREKEERKRLAREIEMREPGEWKAEGVEVQV